MFYNPVAIIAILFFVVVLSEWLSDKAYFRHAGTGLLVIIFGAVLSNVGIIPASTPASPVYDAVFSYIAPLSIFLILLRVNLASLKKAGRPMLIMFLIGSAATVVGVLVSMWLLNGKSEIGEFYYAIAGMYTGTYTGGSLNFNAVALNYNISQEGSLYTAATVADNIMSALWVVATLAIPQFLNKKFPRKKTAGYSSDEQSSAVTIHSDTENVGPFDVAFLLLLGLTAIIVSSWLNHMIPSIPSILWLTTFALILAQIPFIHNLKGHKLLGLLGVYIFLTVIGAYCDIPALIDNGRLALVLLAMVTMLVLVHGVITYGAGALMKQDWDIISIASQANVGGTATAMALARSLDRNELVLPGILAGALGNALGSYLGIMVSEFMVYSGWF
ncbi:MAG: DUF819 family protein [Saprospiraceae bacterium]|nr:DUF819 family protein [Saprospiraceae bacterium]